MKNLRLRALQARSLRLLPKKRALRSLPAVALPRGHYKRVTFAPNLNHTPVWLTGTTEVNPKSGKLKFG
jgi:hypothetical protein